MRTVTVQAGVTIDLGHQYDNYATEVVFPSAIISPFITNFGSTGTFAIWYRRSGDSLGYPIGSPLVTFDSTDSEVTWDVVESDTASPGVSQVQLRYIIGDVCVMSQMFQGSVSDSVDVGTEVPEAMSSWADAIVSAGAGGQPTVTTSASAMADHNTIYLYTGSESGYTNGHIYYWNGSAWTDGGAYGGGSSSGSGLTDDIKQALLDCFEHVAWTDEHGQDYVDALEAALYPPAELASISAVYTQSGTVYDTDTLDSLKSDLVVTAVYSDSTTETVPGTDYTLSGTLTEGTSTIIVSYSGKTDTFDVTVTASEPSALYSLTNGTYSSESGVVTVTISNGNHVRIDFASKVSSNYFINLKDGRMGAGTAGVIDNQPQWFEIPSGVECVLSITNITNSGITRQFNFRKANANSSGSFGVASSSGSTDQSVTNTLATAESVSCLFAYITGNSAGSYIEFDVSFTVGGTKYI